MKAWKQSNVCSILVPRKLQFRTRAMKEESRSDVSFGLTKLLCSKVTCIKLFQPPNPLIKDTLNCVMV